jgi:hypothetical protein
VYDQASVISDFVRLIVNDAIESAGGEIYTDDWPQTWGYMSLAKRMCEQYLADNGVEFNVKEVILSGLTPVTSTDPSVQVYISQTGYFDGSNQHNTPTLPGDLITPLRLFERVMNATNTGYCQVTPANDGIPPALSQGQQFRFWDWRTDTIFLPGATQTNQLRLRYVSFSPDIDGPTAVIPFRRLGVALAYMTAFIFLGAREDVESAGAKAIADEQLDLIVTQTVRKKQRRGVQKRPYGGRGGRSGAGRRSF